MYYRRKKKAGTVTLRDHAYRFFANPVSSVRATKFAALIWLLSFASILTFGIEARYRVCRHQAGDGAAAGSDAGSAGGARVRAVCLWLR